MSETTQAEAIQADAAAENERAPLKIALGIEYDGSLYYGWQRQIDVASVQACLEKALSKVADEPIEVFLRRANRCWCSRHRTGCAFHHACDPKRRRVDDGRECKFTARYRGALGENGG